MSANMFWMWWFTRLKQACLLIVPTAKLFARVSWQPVCIHLQKQFERKKERKKWRKEGRKKKKERNPNVALWCWWGSDCDRLRCCRGALRWRKRALSTAEGAAVYVAANHPGISTEVQELVFEFCPVTRQALECFYCRVDDIKSPCGNPWKGSGNGLFTLPALVH